MPQRVLTVRGVLGYDGVFVPAPEAGEDRAFDSSDFTVVSYSLGTVKGAHACLMPVPGQPYARANPNTLFIYVAQSLQDILGRPAEAFGAASDRRATPASPSGPAAGSACPAPRPATVPYRKSLVTTASGV